MEFIKICELLGGPSATARLLGLADSRDVRRCYSSNECRPNWVPKLKELARKRGEETRAQAEELIKFGESEDLTNDTI